MKLSFFGAAGEVTGSCYLLETGAARVLVDFGLHQGGLIEAEHNLVFPPMDPPRLDAVLLTHAHIDHIGRLPLLPGRGYAGPIYTTDATSELVPILLRDSAKLNEADAARQTFKRQRQDKPPVKPLYTADDAERVFPLLRKVKYDAPVEVARGVKARWYDAGHMLGSGSIELTIETGGRPKTLVFSGDIGHKGTALLRDPVPPPKADVLVMESTYGDRDHRSMSATIDEFARIVQDAIWNKQKVIVPAFAIGRAQQLIYHLGELAQTGRVPRFPVYLDSPMSAAAVEVYRHFPEILDAETHARIDSGQLQESLKDVHIVADSMESKALNDDATPMVIISPSGMCTGGRILHHLKHNIWKKGVHVVIVGFQAHNSLGRSLVEGAAKVRIMRETIPVRATIHTLGGFSGHAGQTELLDWANAVKGIDADRPRVFLTHGEIKPRDALALKMKERFGVDCGKPLYPDSVEI